MKFPTVTGSNLSGKRYQLPQDFEGQYNIVVVVYQRFQQSSVDTWGALLERLAAQHPDLRYYELPTLPNYGWLQQNIIDGGMRSGISDTSTRARTITLYIDVNKFNTALNLNTTDDIYVLVTDRQGEVLWQSNGICTAPKAASLSQKLTELYT